MHDDLSEAPVPDEARLAALDVGRRDDGVVVIAGAPAGVLSVARWLRRAHALHPGLPCRVVLAPPARDEVVEPAVALEVHALVGTPGGPTVVLDGGAVVLAGDEAALADLASAFEVVGVGALDLRWAPVERRSTLAPAGPDGEPDPDAAEPALGAGSARLLVAAAYPLAGDG